MFVVFISARYTTLLPWVNEHHCDDIHSIEFVKKVGPKIFLYVDTALSYSEVAAIFKNAINAHGGMAYVYSIYCFYNGMIDYYDYMSSSKKDMMAYYQSVDKDLSDEEIAVFLKDR